MVEVRRGVATSTHVWPAIPGSPGPPLHGLPGPALALSGGQPQMIQSGGWRLLLLVLLRMIQSGASVLMLASCYGHSFLFFPG